jgi:hypothetical protein
MLADDAGLNVTIYDRPSAAGYGCFIPDPDDPLSDEASSQSRARSAELEAAVGPPPPGLRYIPLGAVAQLTGR